MSVLCRRIGVRSVVTHVRARAAEAKARDAFLVPDKLAKGSVLRGVPVTSVDWSGFGIAKLWVRGDKQETTRGPARDNRGMPTGQARDSAGPGRLV